MVQEELERTRQQLERSRAHNLQLEEILSRNHCVAGGDKCVQNQFDLMRQIAKLQASEKVLSKNVVHEKEKVKNLNEQIMELSRKLQLKSSTEALADSLDSVTSAIHIPIGNRSSLAALVIKFYLDSIDLRLKR